jgi:hypothetical protein
VQSSGEIEHPLEVGPSAAVAAILFGFAQRFPNQVFCQDGFFAVGFVPRPWRLKIEADRAIRACALELGQFTEIFAIDHDPS